MEQVSSTPQSNLNESKPSGTNGKYKITFRKIARAAEAELRVHKKIAIISYVLFGVSTLLFMFNAHFYNINTKSGADFIPSGWGAVFGGMGIIVGFFAALNVFRDVNNQQLCDVTMALPIKAPERFFSKLLALFYLQIGPLLVASLIGNGTAILLGRMRYGNLDPDSLDYLAQIVFGGLSTSLFIMAIVVLCACCSGAKAESAYFSLIMMFIINALPITYVISIIGNVSGFQQRWLYDESGIDVSFWGFLPLFGDYNDIGGFIFHNVISIAISLAVMLLSIFIYKKRDAKTVGTPISSRLFFEIFLVLGCFTIFSFFVFTEAAWWGVLIAGVIYIIINIIVSRAKINVLSFVKWIVKYVVTTAAFIAVMVVTIKTGGFGQINSRPTAEQLNGAHYYITVYEDSTRTRMGITTDELSAEQADQIMEITKKHMVKGFSEISVASMLTDFMSYYGGAPANVYVEAASETGYRDRPSPKRHFRYHWVYDRNSDDSHTEYYLHYEQSLPLSNAEAEAMIDELKALDFVNYEVSKEGKVIETKFVNDEHVELPPMTDDGQYIIY
ncbi:MAG: hypothetical protein K2J77_09890 [Oscillospiraceae bacterium]|nr:hypothetical protein [Oscillospiraceae bacterium]